MTPKHIQIIRDALVAHATTSTETRIHEAFDALVAYRERYSWRTQADEKPPDADVLERVTFPDGTLSMIRIKNGELLYSDSKWMPIPGDPC